MNLTVLNVAYPLAPVGPDAVGGAEQVLTRIDAALVAAGHESIVLAQEGSRAAGALRTISRPREKLGPETLVRAESETERAIAKILARQKVDVVHLHGVDFHAYLPPSRVPALATLHLPPAWYPAQIFSMARPQTYLHCVSRAEERLCPASARLLPPIENGVPVDLFDGRRVKRCFALALGRICPEKGFHVALDAAKRARVPLVLAGALFGYPAHEDYFRREIAPALDGARRFVGAAGFACKRRLLAAARCLLAPSLAPETSSLVAMEALAAGTPVIAFPAGALADIVEHGRTGFLVRDTREMADAIAAADSLDPEACRAAARRRFSAARMTDEYLARYAEIVGAAN
jgi:glycosyltransferase involved in cell wall biosynthesis